MQKETKYMHLRHAKIRLLKTDLKALLSDVSVRSAVELKYFMWLL